MIKKGDKVICIRDYSYISPYDGLVSSFKSGNIYEIIDIDHKAYYISADINNNALSIYNGIWFSSTTAANNLEKFESHFITLAEWRDKQINLILDEN
jgi:hypothetical protein